MIDKFPFIRDTALIMAYDNGMINREQSKEEFLALCESVVGADGVYHEDLVALESWLGSLTSDERETIAAGLHEDIEELNKSCPSNAEGHPLSELFEDIFDRRVT